MLTVERFPVYYRMFIDYFSAAPGHVAKAGEALT
jgi:hypothetical protein